MHRSSVVLVSALLVGCAHTGSEAHTVTVVESAPPPPEREVVAVDAPPVLEAPAAEAPRARPRLSRTVTLGQGQSEAIYTPGPAAPPREGNGPTTNVTVNNTITIQQQPTYGYGGYGGYRYGYGGRGVRGDGFGIGAPARPAWAPNGWEGARRTAAPGATPGVGGNWAPAPSFGPAQMK